MKTYDKTGTLLHEIDESKEIARGGEGRIIDMGSDKVAKLYLPGVKPLEEIKFNELTELKSNTFIKPDELMFDKNRQIIGFVMKKVSSNFYPLLSIFNKNFCVREGISDKVKSTINDNLIDALKFAHNKNIVIGDLNPYNILVNDKGMVHFLDVDSYETPSAKHSGIMLEDIRDFLYGGEVNVNSDYFALSVLMFNSLSYVHPFKGVCKSMPRMADRMCAKRSILTGHPDVIVPKCYESITDLNLLSQFEKIFNLGERFMINIQAKGQTTAKVKKQSVLTVTKTNELVIHIVRTGEIINSYASKERLVLITDQNQMLVYDVSLKGTSKLILEKNGVNPKNKVFVHKNDVYTLADNTLVNVMDDRIMMKFETSSIKSELYGSTLVIVTAGTMYKLDLSTQCAGVISYSTVETYGGRFNGLYSLFQNVSGNTVLFYEKGGLNSVFMKSKIKALHQSGNVGMIEQVENEKMCYKMITIKNMQVEEFDCDYSSIRMFDNLNDSLIVMPNDDKLTFITPSSMTEIASFKTSRVSADSVIHCTNSGIIVRNQDIVYCMNRK